MGLNGSGVDDNGIGGAGAGEAAATADACTAESAAAATTRGELLSLTANGGDSAAGDSDITDLAAVAAAADARAGCKDCTIRIATGGVHSCAAADQDGAGDLAFVAATDTSRTQAALGGDVRTAVYPDSGDAPVYPGVIAAANTCGLVAAGSIDGAAGNGDTAARDIVVQFAAADAGGVLSALGRYVAAGDGNIAASHAVLGSAADARALVAAGGIDSTAVDGDGAICLRFAADAKAAADACGAVAAVSCYASAVDDDITVGINAGIAPVSADTGLVCFIGILIARNAGRTGDQCAGAAALPIDGQAVAAGDGNALAGSKGFPIRQDQMYIAGDGDACGDGYIFIDHIPATAGILASPVCSVALHLCGADAGFRFPGGRVQILYVVHILRQRCGGQQAEA